LLIENNGSGSCFKVTGNDFLEIDGIFNHSIDSQGVYTIGFGHSDHLSAKGILNINENRYRHVVMTNQKNASYDHWVMQYNGETKTVLTPMVT
jgi:hypothetical protein